MTFRFHPTTEVFLIKIGLELFRVYERVLEVKEVVPAPELRIAIYALEIVFVHRQRTVANQMISLQNFDALIYDLGALRIKTDEYEREPHLVTHLYLNIKLLNNRVSDYLATEVGSVDTPPVQHNDSLQVPRSILNRLRSERGLPAA